MEGLHLTADCFECTCKSELLTQSALLEAALRRLTVAAGLTIVGERFHAFCHPDGSTAGVTGALLLAESHLAVHTWPEHQAVTLDVYVCNFNNDNSAKARQLLTDLCTLFQTQRCEVQSLQRGSPATGIAIEQLTPHTSMHTQLGKLIETQISPFQRIEIAETPEFGRVLRLDHALMTSEKDEFYYHESLIHPAAIAHGQPQQALIIGGGDGGSSKELLKHDSIVSITVCEIDEQVVQLARRHLPQIHQHAFDSPKVRLRFEDGLAFIQNDQQQYDLIVLDLTDPITAIGSQLASACMETDFFKACRERLSERGFLILHLGSPFYHPQRYQGTLTQLKSLFQQVDDYTVFIPTYGAQWGMAIATQQPWRVATSQLQARISALEQKQLRYYNAKQHVAFFAHHYLENHR